MGKQRKLRSSIKALHDALTSFRPAVGAPMCIQPAKTHSFRDVLTSFDSIYYTPATSSTSSTSFSGPCSHHGIVNHPQTFPSAEISLPFNGEREDEETISISATATATTSCSSCLSSSSAIAAAAPVYLNEDEAEAEAEAEPFPSGIVFSERFFFSPCTSKSIVAESFPEMGSKKIEPLHGDPRSGPEGKGDCDEEDDVFGMLMEREIDTLIEGAMTTGVSALCRESIPMVVASRNPYKDFRSSMEEMVAAYSIGNWPGFQELLHCYLRLNEKKTHKFIVLAFTDLLMHLASEGKVHSSVVHGATSTPTFASPSLTTARLHSGLSES